MKRLSRGDPGVLDRIRERYGLTIYAIAYGVLMDPRMSEHVVDETFAECGREARTAEFAQEKLYDRLAATARRLSGETQAIKKKPLPATQVPVPTKVVRERWIPSASPASAWSLLI